MIDGGASTAGGTLACAIPGLEDEHCRGQLCTADGDAFLWLTKDTPFKSGAQTWVVTACDDPLSGPFGGTHDGVNMFWGVTLKQLRALRDGVEVRAFYGTTSEIPQVPPDTLACTLAIETPIPTCPEEFDQPKHSTKRGCRGPLDDYCAV